MFCVMSRTHCIRRPVFRSHLLLALVPAAVAINCGGSDDEVERGSLPPGYRGPATQSGNTANPAVNNSQTTETGSSSSSGATGNSSADPTGGGVNENGAQVTGGIDSNSMTDTQQGTDGGEQSTDNSTTNDGAGGSSMAGVDDTVTGAGGTGMEEQGAGGAGFGGEGQGDNTGNQDPPLGSAGCEGSFICDDFEGVNAGGSPDGALWSIVAGYNYNSGATPLVQVSAANSFSGSQALRVEQDALAGIFTTVPQTRFFVRAMMQVDAAPLGPVLMGLGGPDHNNELRFRIQNNSWATINVVPSDAVLPQAAREGNCPTCPSVPVNEWFCLEFFADDVTQSTTMWMDGVEIASSENGGSAWPTFPAQPTVRIGTMSLQGGGTGVWIDDVVIGPNRIGCD